MILWGIIGHKNTGKTTLTERLVRDLSGRGLVVSTLKRTHHNVDLEQAGSDTHRHRIAGAHQVVLASDRRLTVMEEVEAPTLLHLATRLSPCDVVLAEGWKAGTHRRIETWRAGLGTPPLASRDETIAAVAALGDCAVDCPVIDLDDVAAIADFLLT